MTTFSVFRKSLTTFWRLEGVSGIDKAPLAAVYSAGCACGVYPCTGARAVHTIFIVLFSIDLTIHSSLMLIKCVKN